jgi:hypothetical protein
MWGIGASVSGAEGLPIGHGGEIVFTSSFLMGGSNSAAADTPGNRAENDQG